MVEKNGESTPRLPKLTNNEQLLADRRVKDHGHQDRGAGEAAGDHCRADRGGATGLQAPKQQASILLICFVFSPVGFQGNVSLLDVCCFFSRGLEQMEAREQHARFVSTRPLKGKRFGPASMCYQTQKWQRRLFGVPFKTRRVPATRKGYLFQPDGKPMPF